MLGPLIYKKKNTATILIISQSVHLFVFGLWTFG